MTNRTDDEDSSMMLRMRYRSLLRLQTNQRRVGQMVSDNAPRRCATTLLL